jgi:hypothetical protein
MGASVDKVGHFLVGGILGGPLGFSSTGHGVVLVVDGQNSLPVQFDLHESPVISRQPEPFDSLEFADEVDLVYPE